MAEFAHESVLLHEVLEHLATRDDGVYVDGTLGGAGHAEALLDRLPNASLIGIDRDPIALAAAGKRLARFGDRVRLIDGTFADVLVDGFAQVDGILLDLGVSSPQLDDPNRGFSFGKPGPIDMRMDATQGPTALDLIRDTPTELLGDVIRKLGEERYAQKIARMLKEAVQEDRLATTADLAAVIARAIPAAEQRKSKIHPATRTFQALRIAVNGELDELERFLGAFPDLLKPGGRCAIISFHSLEDRMVKQRFRDLAWTSSMPAKFAGNERLEAVCTEVTHKAIVATDEEIARNPRSRSAKLRVCERTGAPNVPSGAPATSRFER